MECGTNPFLRSTMSILGGGESRLLSKLSTRVRQGGGIDDVWKYCHIIDQPLLREMEFTVSLETVCSKLGLEFGKLSMLSVDNAALVVNQNLEANPGPGWKTFGFKKKAECLCSAWDIARKIMDSAKTSGVIGICKPRYSMAGRPKLRDRDQHAERISAGKPLGRPVWMADAHEALIAGTIGYPLMHFLHEKLEVICNGFNKFSDDPTRLSKQFEVFDTQMNLDMESFDTSVSFPLMRKAFDVLYYAFGVHRGDSSQTDHILEWLEDEITRCELVTPNGRVLKTNGVMPSGSGLTALVDSIVNSIVWIEVLNRKGIDDYTLKVQGDDVLLGVNLGKKRPQKFLRQVGEIITHYYGMRLNIEKTHVSHKIYVGYAQPKVPAEIRDGSSKVHWLYRQRLKEAKGRPLKFGEEFSLLDEEPIGPAPGYTHRWTYVFADRMRFLSHYFKKDDSSPDGRIMCVRPTAEVVDNLLHPERPVRTLRDHNARLLSAHVENFGNHHVTNRIMHYVYDSWILQKRGVYLRGDMRGPLAYRRGAFRSRGWYRHTDKITDLLIDDSQFAQFWRGFEESARRVHSSVFGSRYASWEDIRRIRRGDLRFGLGFSLAREFGDADRASINDLSRKREALGAVGFGIWSSKNSRDQISSAAFQGLNLRPFNSRTSPTSVFSNYINLVRDRYESDVI